MRDAPNISWTWEEGRYWDLWMFVHIVAGMVIGSALLCFGVPFSSAAIIAFLLMVAAELIEIVKKIPETRENRVMDVVVGMIGFLTIYIFTGSWSSSMHILTLVTLVALSAVLNFLGWRAWLRRGRQH